MTNTERRRFLGRLTLGMSGQVFSRVILAAYTVVLVPVLIRAWGVDGYGQWIALTALTSYMGLSNFGLVTTSANEMVIATGAGDIARARRTFQNSINLTIYVFLPLIALLVAVISMVPVSRGLNLTQIDTYATREIIVCAGAALWFQTVRGLMVAALYATGSYGLAYYVQGAMKLLELCGMALLVLVFAGSQVSAAILTAGVALLELLLITGFARRAAPWARIDLRILDRSWIGTQIKPAIGFMISNLATQGLMTQAPRVILGAMLGGTAVALYAVYATAMRFVDQLLLTIVLPLEVEIAHCAGGGHLKQINKLIVLGTHISWVCFLFVSIALLSFGPLIFQIWTTNRIHFSYGLMVLYLFMSAANLQGRVSLHALISTNRLYGPSFLMLASAAGTVALGAGLTRFMGINGMVLGGAAGEIINSIVVIVAVSHWLKKSPRAMFGELLTMKGSLSDLGRRMLQTLRQYQRGI